MSQNIHERHLRLAQQTVMALTKPSPSPMLEEIWLYGSVAREQDNEFSDVDLLVILAKGGDTWLPGVTAVFELLEKAQLPIRPRGRRRERHPDTVQVDFFPAPEFKHPELLLPRDSSSSGFRAMQNTVKFLNTAKTEGRRLYP